MTIRSVRNNNPCNIRIGEKWQGLMAPDHMTPEQAAEKEFCVFQNPAYGFRAAAKLFANYRRLYGVNTVSEGVKRLAPPNENNTSAYIRAVCDYTAMKPEDTWPFPGRPAQQRSFLKACAIHEAGGWYFTQSDLSEGVSMAEED